MNLSNAIVNGNLCRYDNCVIYKAIVEVIRSIHSSPMIVKTKEK